MCVYLPFRSLACNFSTTVLLLYCLIILQLVSWYFLNSFHEYDHNWVSVQVIFYNRNLSVIEAEFRSNSVTLSCRKSVCAMCRISEAVLWQDPNQPFTCPVSRRVSMDVYMQIIYTIKLKSVVMVRCRGTSPAYVAPRSLKETDCKLHQDS